MSAKKISTAFDVLKTTGILKTQPEETLGKIISQLRNSHDAVFVFDKNDKFLGVVSFINIFKHRSHNEKTKVKNIVKMPPKLTLSSRLPEIAKKMLNSQIYFLPVFDNDNKFLGIVSANRIFKFVKDNNLLSDKDRLLFSPRTMTKLKEEDSISQVLNELNRSKASKAIIMDDADRMSGIISRFDLRNISQNGERTSSGSRIGEKTSELDEPIKSYVKKVFFTVKKIPNFSMAYQMMKENKINSLIMVDNNNDPINIITRRDLLNTIAENEI